MKATYKNSFCMDNDCINYFEDMCMLCMMETESEIEPYNIQYIEEKGRGSIKDCKSFKRGSNIIYEIDLTDEDFIENQIYKIATRYKYEGEHPKVKCGDIFKKNEFKLYKEVEGPEVTLGELAKLYIAVDSMLYDFSTQWEDGFNPYDFMEGVMEIMRETSMPREHKHFQDCKECEFTSRIDGACDYHMAPTDKEGYSLCCEIKEGIK